MKINKILIIAAIASVTINSCKKGCNDPEANNFEEKAKKDDGTCDYTPMITLNGSASVFVRIGENYTELGATAATNNGTSLDVTVDNTAVNTSTAGTYTVTYTATYEGDIATASRTVTVGVDQDSYVGDWTCASDCGTTVFPVDGTRTIVAGTGSTQIQIDGFFTLLGGSVVANISGLDIVVPQQTIPVTGGDITLSGTGSMNAAGTAFTIDYSYDNTIPLIGGSGTCTATYSL